jgi:hypothetical protein
MQLSVKGDVKDITKDLSKIQRKLVPSAASQALNAASKDAVKQSIPAISKATGIPQKHIRSRYSPRSNEKKASRIHIRKRGKAKAKKLWAEITDYFQAGIDVTSLGARDTGKGGWKARKGSGVHVRKGPRRHIDDAWIWKHKNIALRRRTNSTGPKGGKLVQIKAYIEKPARAVIRKVIARRSGKKFVAEFQTRLTKKLKAKGL